MRGREGKGPPSADLLVCFPSRAHLTLMAPKPNVCSPSRPSDSNSRHRRRHHHHQQQQQQQQSHHVRNASRSGGGGHASPLLWAKTKPNNDVSEPTSPKVTCAGQIKVRNKPNSCKSWQSVMEEIERLHNNRNKKKKHHAWAEALGFKKDVMHFLTCLRNIRFDFRCFGSFPSAVITSDDEDDEEEEDEEEETYHTNVEKDSKEEIDDSESSRTFSKWFMILQENDQSSEVMKPDGKRGKTIRSYFDEEKFKDDDNDNDNDGACAPPPPNALLLMRCRSAPAKSWLEDKEEEEKSESSNDHEEKERNEEEQRKTEETERLHVVMGCGTDFSKFSSDIAKETWVVGGIKDMLSRSRSSRR